MVKVPKTNLGLGIRPDFSQCRDLSEVLVDMSEGGNDIVYFTDLLKKGGEGSCLLMREN